MGVFLLRQAARKCADNSVMLGMDVWSLESCLDIARPTIFLATRVADRRWSMPWGVSRCVCVSSVTKAPAYTKKVRMACWKAAIGQLE